MTDRHDNPAADGERAARYDNLQTRVAAALRERKVDAIKTNIVVLDHLVQHVAYFISQAATDSANDQNQNGAIGGLMLAESDLELALTLVRASLALHRS